jgi:oxygen-independent coproporphyrinogen-3 oxidase
MKAELERSRGLAVRTVYVGGGTPTVLPAALLTDLLRTAFACHQVAADAEITVEANPGTVDPVKLDALREAGVNRISLGAQAIQKRLLETLGRIHRFGDVDEAFRAARGAGFDNISLDVMYGLPGQTPRDFRQTLEAVLALGPEHLSAYSLILEEGTPFYDRYNGRPELMPGEDELLEMADDLLWMAGSEGYERYEISNFAKPGRESKHNLGYWLRGEYLGIGVAAHSLIRDHRFANPESIDAYLSGVPGDRQIITPAEARFERLMLGLRLVRGIEWGEQALIDEYMERFRLLRERGLLDFNEQRVWLTPRGMDLQNRVLVELMGE